MYAVFNMYSFLFLFLYVLCVRFLARDPIARIMLLQDGCLSAVRPFVCHMPVFCRNGKTYPQTFFTSGNHTILVLSILNCMTVFQQEPP